MAKVLIATLYSPDAVLLAATKLGTDRLVLLIDEDPNETQLDGLKTIKESLGRVIDVKEAKIPVYNIVTSAKEIVKIIDQQPSTDTVYANVTSGRKTAALALLYACYARIHLVKKIAYNTEESKEVIYLPKLSFNLTESQKRLLEFIEKGKYSTLEDLADKTSMSRGMLYRNIKELGDMGLVESGEGVVLTDAGRLSLL